MKNIILILALVVLGVNAKAQYTTSVPAVTDNAWHSITLPYYTAGDDTASGADVIRMGIIMNNAYDINIVTTVTKASGTIDVASALYVRSSPNGTNWNDICQAATVPYKDTFFMANATTTASWSYNANEVNGKYVEVYYNQATGTNPVTAPVTTLYYRKRKDY